MHGKSIYVFFFFLAQELYHHQNGPPKQNQVIYDSDKIMSKISTKYAITPRKLFMVLYFGLLGRYLFLDNDIILL